jgi:small redox-active disulfide protein 2
MVCIKILGAGCRRCRLLEAETRAALDEANIHREIIVVTDYADIASYGVLQLPGLVINEQVILTGRIPKRQEIVEWVQHFHQGGRETR